MAQRDYVSRGQSPKKKQQTQKKRKTSQQNILTSKNDLNMTFWIRALGVLVLVGGFGFFLWSINGSAPADNLTRPASAVAQQEDELPELPKDEWEYIKGLPGYEVEVDEQAIQKSDKRYLMQCASFRTRLQAEELKAKIAFQGFESQIRRSSGKNGEWFRVILGPIDSKREAERIKHALMKVSVNNCQIWFWNLNEL